MIFSGSKQSRDEREETKRLLLQNGECREGLIKILLTNLKIIDGKEKLEHSGIISENLYMKKDTNLWSL